MRSRTSILIGATLLLAACTATQQVAAPGTEAPGIVMGFWHGFIAPVAFIISIFADNVRIYAFPNSGLWYDLGFMLGIGGFSSGLFAGSRGRSRK